ncbi:hypothetical protein CPB84DRAFT_1786156 [Gymnopilus junonius]|uniref:Uncharacterized protein n=1 Tax=Gymnopilus junonius TaxID=109634 RepID=A0A9P5NKA0_GYMJU|nr:hypothetical protein CPB84DRAFT_1786156 [Gymnopilus junonius]
MSTKPLKVRSLHPVLRTISCLHSFFSRDRMRKSMRKPRREGESRMSARQLQQMCEHAQMMTRARWIQI